MRRAALAPTALLAGVAAAQLGQQGPDPAVVAVGATATLTLRLDDAAPDAVLGALPSIDGLRLSAEALPRTTRQTLRDGHLLRVASASFRVEATPTRAGSFVVPPLAVTSAGRTATTTPVQLEALAPPDGAGRAFLEVTVDRDRPWLQQPIEVTVRFGFVHGFVEDGLIPMFARPLDLPVQVRWSWPEGAAGVAAVPTTDSGTVRFALDAAVASAQRVGDVERDGQTFTTFEVRRRVVATASGTLTVPAPVLRFAYATRFDDDFVNGRVAADRHEAWLSGRPLALEVEALPETLPETLPDAPPAPTFSGAVGQFAVHARTASSSARTGDSLQLVLEVTGTGNLATFAPPAFALEGFHVLGCTSTLRGDARVLTYDITPTDVAVRAVPPLAFAYFDPTAGTYRVARTVALPLAVSAGTLSSKAAIPRTAGVDDIYPPPALPANPGDPHALRHLTVALALAQPWLAALLVFAWQRARARARHDPLGQRARRAAAAFAAAIRAPATDPGDALAEYLAARLRCPRAAVVGPDLEARLAAAGVAAPLGVRTAELLRDLLAARYGGTATDDRDAPARLVAELEAVFTAAGGAA